MNISKKKLHQIIFWIAGIALLTYSTIRAIKIPITIDEGTTFLVYVQQSFKDVFFNTTVNSNNHFLNTYLIKLSTWIFGDSQLSVRLPSLFGYLLYIIFSFKLLQAISNRTIVILTGIALFHLNPYLNDFFGLARGYSLSWGLMLGSMYYLYRYIEVGKNKFVNWSFALAGLSVYSILIALNYFLALIITFNFVFLKEFFTQEKKTSFVFYFLKKNLPAIITSIILIAILLYPILSIRSRNEFHGEHGSFYQNTILSLINQSLFGREYFGWDFPDVLFGLSLAVYLSVIFHALKGFSQKKHNNILTGSLAFSILFTFACWSTVFQFHLIGTPYLADRTALIYVPLFSILPVFFFKYLDKKKWLQLILCLFPLFAYSYHFATTFRTHTVREWWFDDNTKDVLNYFLKNEKRNQQVTFAVSGRNSPSFHFYEKVWNLEDKVDMIRKDQLAKNEFYDYYYIEADWMNQISIERYEVLEKFDSRVLLKLKPQ